MVATVYLVVTVTMNRRQVVIPVVAVVAIQMMDFDQRLRRKDESAGFAASLLPFKQGCRSVRYARVVPAADMRFFTSLYAYRLSKVALNMAMRVLAVDTRERGILIGILAPGVVETRLLQQAGYGGRGMPPQDSVAAVIRNIENLNADTAGQYTLYSGETVPW